LRLIRLTTNHPTYLRDFYIHRPGLENKSYAVQYRELMDDCFGWADFWTRAMGRLGYEVWEPVANAEPMQKVWAKEHDINYDESKWLHDITLQQVKNFSPDVIFVNDYNTFSPDFLNTLRKGCRSIEMIIGWCGAPFRYVKTFKAYDLVLTNIPSLLEHFRHMGISAEYMPHAFCPGILKKIDIKVTPDIPCSFIGSFLPGKKFHHMRIKLVEYIVNRNVDLSIWSDIANKSVDESFINRAASRIRAMLSASYRCINDWDKAINYKEHIDAWKLHYAFQPHVIDQQFARIAKPAVYGLGMYQQLHNSLMTLNTHIGISQQYASNMRLFEATGVGTCLLTEKQKSLTELFEPDTEVITYSSREEAVEKIRYILTHDAERQSIAKAGQKRTLREHTFDIRAQQLDEIIRSRLRRC